MIARSWLLGVGILGALLTAVPAYAQDADAGDDQSKGDAADKAGSDDKDSDKADADDKAESEGDDKEKEESATAEEAGDANSPVEQKGKTYRFVGARYRLIVVPKFIISMFADGGTTVAAHSFGPEFSIRKDNFEYGFGLWYSAYSMDPTPFKSKSDSEEAWELVESRIKVLYATVDFLWSHDFTPQVAVNYGMGAGLGLVFGQLLRNQAYRNPNGNGYLPCVDSRNPPFTVPGTTVPYCGDDNKHYGNFEEPSWSSGGSKPIIFPWLAVQTGLRYKPTRAFVGRLDVGFGLSGFFFGLGADYGL